MYSQKTIKQENKEKRKEQRNIVILISMMQQQQRTRIRRMKDGCRTRWQQIRQNKEKQQQQLIVHKQKQSSAVPSCRDSFRKGESRPQQLKQRSILTPVDDTVSSDAATTNNKKKVHNNKKSLRPQRTRRHRKTLTESTLLCSITRMVDCCDFNNSVFDGSFSSSTNNSNEGGAFAEFIFDSDSEDELYDEHETSYWEGCQGS